MASSLAHHRFAMSTHTDNVEPGSKSKILLPIAEEVSNMVVQLNSADRPSEQEFDLLGFWVGKESDNLVSDRLQPRFECSKVKIRPDHHPEPVVLSRRRLNLQETSSLKYSQEHLVSDSWFRTARNDNSSRASHNRCLGQYPLDSKEYKSKSEAN